MKPQRRMFVIIVAMAMATMSVLFVPAVAAGVVVPPDPNIVDPVGDANGVNDQGFSVIAEGVGPGHQGDVVTGGPSLGVADIAKAWFTHTSTHVSAHIQTVLPPPDVTPGTAVIYRVMFNPDPANSADGCTWFQAIFEGRNYLNSRLGSLRELCVDPIIYRADLDVERLSDGTGIISITIPRTANPAFDTGGVLQAPRASTRIISGGGDLPESPTLPQVDNTLPGRDYVMSDITVAPAPTEPEQEDPCAKKKGKAKKKCRKKHPKPTPSSSPAPSPSGSAPSSGGVDCPAYNPPGPGADAELFTVTDAHTEAAPLEVTVDLPQHAANPVGFGLPPGPIPNHRNVQLATAADRGLFVRFEFPALEDNDLYLLYPDGTEAGHAAGGNQILLIPGAGQIIHDDLYGVQPGGHSEGEAEQLDGVHTASCQGWTLNFSAYLTQGGPMTVKLWAGDVVNEPTAPASPARFSK